MKRMERERDERKRNMRENERIRECDKNFRFEKQPSTTICSIRSSSSIFISQASICFSVSLPSKFYSRKPFSFIPTRIFLKSYLIIYFQDFIYKLIFFYK